MIKSPQPKKSAGKMFQMMSRFEDTPRPKIGDFVESDEEDQGGVMIFDMNVEEEKEAGKTGKEGSGKFYEKCGKYRSRTQKNLFNDDHEDFDKENEPLNSRLKLKTIKSVQGRDSKTKKFFHHDDPDYRQLLHDRPIMKKQLT